MLSRNFFFPRLSMPTFMLGATFTLGIIAASGTPILGQEAQAIHVGEVKLTGIPDDWTHHHLIFGDPGTAEDALRNGKYDEWFRITNDPRYVMQQMKRGTPARGSAADDVARFEESRKAARDAAIEERIRRSWERHMWPSEKIEPVQPTIDKDWSMVLGGSATVGAGMFPAKFSFNATSTSPLNCGDATTPDFVVYNTSTAGSATQASVVAYDNIYAGTCTGLVPTVYWAYNTGGTVRTSVTLSLDGTKLAFIQTPSSGNAQLVLLTWKATPTGRNVTSGTTNITSGSKTFTATAGMTSMDVGAVISGTGIPTGDTIATVTSAKAGTLTTAASGNGTSGETLSISADAGGPDTLTAVSNATYSTCTAPCMTTLTFSGTSRSDTISSAYYDYGSDTLYVGDSAGGLHKFNPVFAGTPAEVGSPWATLDTTAVSSPVYDSTTEKVFAGDGSGYVYSVDSAGTVTKSVQVAVSPGFVDGPLVDSTNGQLYLIAVEDTNASNTGTESTCEATNHSYETCNGIINLPTSFTASTKFLESVIGVSTDHTLYDGAFDNLYWSTGTGNLYSVGGNGTDEPKLMETPITAAGIADTSTACANTGSLPNCSDLRCANNVDNPMTSATAAGSPVTEILNDDTDYIFTSVSANANQVPTGCTGACIESWIVTTALTGTTTKASAGATEAGGTSGIIVDNVSATTGASQIYFSTLGTTGTCTTSGTLTTGGCAIQTSQPAP